MIIITRYYVLAVAVVLVVFAQQSEAGVFDVFKAGLDAIKDELNIGNKGERDTIRIIEKSSKENKEAKVFVDITIDLRQAHINATKLMAKSEEIIMDAIKAAQKSLGNTEAAKKLLQQAFRAARKLLYQSGVPVLRSIGKALGLSNNGARHGLEAASQFIQKVGTATLDAVNAADTLSSRGIDPGGKAAKVLLKAALLIIESGFSAGFKNIQESIKVAQQALRDAQSRPMQGQVENRNCEAAAIDPEGSDALNAINESAKNALKRGANLGLVQKFKEGLKCSISDLVNIAAEGRQTVQHINEIAAIEPEAAKIIYFKQAETLRKRIYEVTATVVLVLGEVTANSGNHSNNKINEAITAIEQGLIEILLAIEIAGDLIVNGLRYPGDAPELGVEAAAMSGFYGKTAFLQGLVEAARLVISVL